MSGYCAECGETICDCRDDQWRGRTPTNAEIIADLRRAACVFQARAIATVIHGSPIAAPAASDARTGSLPLSGAGVTSSRGVE